MRPNLQGDSILNYLTGDSTYKNRAKYLKDLDG